MPTKLLCGTIERVEGCETLIAAYVPLCAGKKLDGNYYCLGCHANENPNAAKRMQLRKTISRCAAKISIQRATTAYRSRPAFLYTI